MSFSQHILQRLTLGEVEEGDCSSHLYHSCSCSQRSEYIGAYNSGDYYTVWSFVWFCITMVLLVVCIPLSKKITKSNILNYLIYPLIVAGISNTITIGLVSQMLFTNLKVDTPDDDIQPQAIDFYGVNAINKSNFLLHILPLCVSFLAVFLINFIKIDKKLSFFRLFSTSIMVLMLVFFIWMIIPIKVIKKSEFTETVWGFEKIDYTYSLPPLYIYFTFPLIALLSIGLLSFTVVYLVK